MGGFLVLLLQSLVQTTEANSISTTDATTTDANHDYQLPAFVFGADGEFLGRVDTPAFAGSERGQ
jgi:hypothetical protein